MKPKKNPGEVQGENLHDPTNSIGQGREADTRDEKGWNQNPEGP